MLVWRARRAGFDFAETMVFRRFRVFRLFLVIACAILQKMRRSSASELSIQLRTSFRKFSSFPYLKMHLYVYHFLQLLE